MAKNEQKNTNAHIAGWIVKDAGRIGVITESDPSGFSVLWIPADGASSAMNRLSHKDRQLNRIGQLKPGVTLSWAGHIDSPRVARILKVDYKNRVNGECHSTTIGAIHIEVEGGGGISCVQDVVQFLSRVDHIDTDNRPGFEGVLVELLESAHREIDAIKSVQHQKLVAGESEIELLRAAQEQHRERICKAANAADDLVEKARDLDAMVRLLVNQPEILDEDFGTHVKAFAQEVFVDAGLLRGRLH